MNRSSAIAFVVVGWILGLGERAADAGLVTWEFSGEITLVSDPDNDLGGAITVGTPFSGSFTFESTTPDSSPESVGFGLYSDAITAVSGQVGAFAFSGESGFTSQIRITDSPAGDNDILSASAGSVGFSGIDGVSTFKLLLSDPEGLSFASDALPLLPPDLGVLNLRSVSFNFNQSSAFVSGEISVLIPEPGTLALLAFGALALLKRRRFSPSLGAFGVLLVMGLGGRAADAGPVTWEFSGEIIDVLDVDNVLGGAITVGTPFSGSFTFESETPDSNPSDPVFGLYDDAVMAVSGQMGGLLFLGSDELSSTIGVRDFRVGQDNDQYLLTLNDVDIPVGNNPFSFSLLLADADGSFFDNDSLPRSPPDLSASIAATVSFRANGTGSDVLVSGNLQVLVPEPGSLALLAFGALTLLKRRRQPPCDAVDTKHRPR